MFEIEAVLETFERFLDAPALVIELAEAVGWKAFVVEQIGHQHAMLAIGQDVTNQAHALRLARALVLQRILLVRRTQHDEALDGARAHELAHAGVAAVVSVDAHAKFDGALVQYGDQPTGGIAAIKQQQVIGGNAVEVFDQKLAFATLVDTVQGGGQRSQRRCRARSGLVTRLRFDSMSLPPHLPRR